MTTAGVVTMCPTKNLLMENKEAKVLFVQKLPRRAWGKKKPSKWRNKSPQMENALLRFSN